MIAVALLTLPAPSASASILTPIGFTRYIDIQNNALAVHTRDNGPAFGPWSDMLAVDNEPGTPGFIQDLYAQFTLRVAQTSDMTPQGITFSGQDAIRYTGGFSLPNVGGTAMSYCAATFDVSDLTDYVFSHPFPTNAQGTSDQSFDSSQLVSLPSGSTVLIGAAGTYTGVLSPGRYILIMSEYLVHDGPASFNAGPTAFSFSFTVPTPSALPAAALFLAPFVLRRRPR